MIAAYLIILVEAADAARPACSGYRRRCSRAVGIGIGRFRAA
jgi:hypothetical protein